MKRTTQWGLLGLGLALAAAPATAQSGFALKGGLVFNSSDVQGQSSHRMDPSDAAGFHVGAEVALPLGLAVGVSGYTAGSPNHFDVSRGSLVTLGEANYFLNLPLLPVTPYAGVHVGLGTYGLRDVEGESPRPEVNTGDLGYQVGLRFQMTSALGLDAQFRRVSFSLQDEQGAQFERSQLLLGVALF